MSNQLGALSRTVEQSGEQVRALYDQGGKHLAKMRELVSSRGPSRPRSDAFGTEATALLGVIASLRRSRSLPPSSARPTTLPRVSLRRPRAAAPQSSRGARPPL